MSERIRLLERALEIEYARSHPTGTHPLLHEDHLRIKSFLSTRESSDSAEQERGEVGEGEPEDAPGTLAIALDGSVQYFGRSAGTEVRITIYHSV